MRACRLLASKSALAARVDSSRGYPTGQAGTSLRAEIHKKIDKWPERPPGKQPKPLPVRKKRGGRRLRKMKERCLKFPYNFFYSLNLPNDIAISIRYAITDMQKLANRMQFGVPEESSLGTTNTMFLSL